MATIPCLCHHNLLLHHLIMLHSGICIAIKTLIANGYPAVVYSGSIERIDFGERKEEKGFCLVTIAEKGKTSYEFITVPTRPFIQIELKLVSGFSQTDQLLEAIKKYDMRDAIVKIIYHVPKGKKDLVDLKAVSFACQAALDLIGVIPVHDFESREKRIGALKVDMDLPTLLSSYFATKPELHSKQNDLIEKALTLWQHHLEQQEEHQE